MKRSLRGDGCLNWRLARPRAAPYDRRFRDNHVKRRHVENFVRSELAGVDLQAQTDAFRTRPSFDFNKSKYTELHMFMTIPIDQSYVVITRALHIFEGLSKCWKHIRGIYYIGLQFSTAASRQVNQR